MTGEAPPGLTHGEPWPDYDSTLPLLAVRVVPPGAGNRLVPDLAPACWTYVVYERLGQYIGWTQSLATFHSLFASEELQRDLLRKHHAYLDSLAKRRAAEPAPLGLTLEMILGDSLP